MIFNMTTTVTQKKGGGIDSPNLVVLHFTSEDYSGKFVELPGVTILTDKPMWVYGIGYLNGELYNDVGIATSYAEDTYSVPLRMEGDDFDEQEYQVTFSVIQSVFYGSSIDISFEQGLTDVLLILQRESSE